MSGTVFILSNLGTPSAPTDEAVAAYLKEFLYDPAVIPLPALLRYPLVHWLIAPRRAKQSAEKYRSIWMDGGSPLLVHSLALQKEVQRHLREPVLLGMRYGNPSLKDAVKRALELNAKKVVLLPLYPQFAEATTGGTIAYFQEQLTREGFRGEYEIFSSFPDAPWFTKSSAEKIRPVLTGKSHLLLSFHGLPLKQAGEYPRQCLYTAQKIAEHLGLPQDRWTLSFQSRFGRAKWLGPHTEELLLQLPKQGKTELVIAAPSFVADCLETVEELGIAGKETFLKSGGHKFSLVPCLNGDADFARGLAETLETLSSPGSARTAATCHDTSSEPRRRESPLSPPPHSS
ncbi:MAG TPA: ferrochelatase [Bdellovibrionota bacterium]|jgi:ferrochelatase